MSESNDGACITFFLLCFLSKSQCLIRLKRIYIFRPSTFNMIDATIFRLKSNRINLNKNNKYLLSFCSGNQREKGKHMFVWLSSIIYPMFWKILRCLYSNIDGILRDKFSQKFGVRLNINDDIGLSVAEKNLTTEIRSLLSVDKLNIHGNDRFSYSIILSWKISFHHGYERRFGSFRATTSFLLYFPCRKKV